MKSEEFCAVIIIIIIIILLVIHESTGLRV